MGLTRKWASSVMGIGKEVIWQNPSIPWNDQIMYDIDWIRGDILHTKDLWDNIRNTWHAAKYIANNSYPSCGRESITGVH